MKKLILVLLVALIGFSACGRRYTCPTYLKSNEENKDVKAKTEEKKTEKADQNG
jgi:predicted small lipoprotein YifL